MRCISAKSFGLKIITLLKGEQQQFCRLATKVLRPSGVWYMQCSQLGSKLAQDTRTKWKPIPGAEKKWMGLDSR